MISVQVKGLDGVKAKLKRLSTELQQGKAMQAAINKTATKAQAEINRAIREEYAVNASDVRNSISISGAKAGRLQARIDIFGSTKRRGRSLNLIHFLAAYQARGVGAVKTRAGRGIRKKDLAAIGKQLGFKIKHGGGLKQIAGVFVGNKGRTVFVRDNGTTMDTRSRYAGTKHGEQIRPVQVIGYSQMFSSRKIHARVMAKISADFPVELDRAIKMILERAK